MITLEHPYAAPTLTLTLRGPEHDNSEQVNIRTQYRKSMDGTIYGYVRTPDTRKLLYSFTEITKSKVQELFDFLAASGGDELKLTDHQSVVWRGYLTVNPVETTTVSRKGGACIEVSTVILEFNGSQV